MVKGFRYSRKKSKPKYGYKGKTVRASQFSLRDVLSAIVDPAVRIFTQGMGIDYGVTKVGGKNVPWAGATAGATSKADAIAKVRSKSPGVADRMDAFSKSAEAQEGTVGSVWVRNSITGDVYPISQLAFNLHMAGKAKGVLEQTSRPSVRIPSLVTA